jgi:hypothetical protein
MMVREANGHNHLLMIFSRVQIDERALCKTADGWASGGNPYSITEHSPFHLPIYP